MPSIIVAAAGENGTILELPAELEVTPGTRLEAVRSGEDIVLSPALPESGRTEPYTLETIRSRVAPIAKDYGARRIWVFDAYARGDAAADSTVRFLVEVSGSGDLGDLLPDLIRIFSAPVQVVDVRDKSLLPEDLLGDPLLIYEA